jgi:hypothetical protein
MAHFVTTSYARAVLGCAFPPLDSEEIDQLTTARMERRALLERKPMCVVSVVIEEAALRGMVGGPEVMRAQCEYLLACTERPNVVIQVMPFGKGAHAGLQGVMKLVETPEQTTLAYMEGNGHSTLVSRPNEVGVLARRYAMIRSQALRPEETAVLIEQLAGEL